MQDLATSLLEAGRNAPCIASIAQAIRDCNVDSVLQAHRFAAGVLDEKRSNDRRLKLRAELVGEHPRLVAEFDADPSEDKWTVRGRELLSAWQLSAARNSVDARAKFDPNATQAEIAQIDVDIHSVTGDFGGSWLNHTWRMRPS